MNILTKYIIENLDHNLSFCIKKLGMGFKMKEICLSFMNK